MNTGLISWRPYPTDVNVVFLPTLERFERACRWQHAVLIDSNRRFEFDDAHIVEEERVGRVQRMRRPVGCLDRVRSGKRVVVGCSDSGLHVGLGEHSHAGELTGFPGAVTRREYKPWRDQSAATTERRSAVDFHQDEDHRGCPSPSSSPSVTALAGRAANTVSTANSSAAILLLLTRCLLVVRVSAFENELAALDRSASEPLSTGETTPHWDVRERV